MDPRKRLVPTYLARREPQLGQLKTVDWRILILEPEMSLQLEGYGKGGSNVRGRWRTTGFNIAYPIGRDMFEAHLLALIDDGMSPVSHFDIPSGAIGKMREVIAETCGALISEVGKLHPDGSIVVSRTSQAMRYP